MIVQNGKLGCIDDHLYEKAKALGINLAGGYVRNTDRRVVIGNRLFLSMGSMQRYVMRSRIVWWLETGEFLIGNIADLHHKNHDRIDDRFENLEKKSHSEHSSQHGKEHSERVARKCICKQCGESFFLPQHRLRELGRGSYCSQKCYQSSPKSSASKAKVSNSLRLAYAEGRR